MSEPVRRRYDRAAARYDRRWAGYVRRTLDLLEARAAVRPGERVLDVGCGTGAFEERLIAANPQQEVVGVDVSAGMLAEARRKLAAAPTVRFVEAEATRLPFDDGAFDTVVSASALHYVPDPAAALGEVARVLAVGGRLVLLDWDRSRPGMAVLDAVLRVLDPAHAGALSAAEAEALLGQGGQEGSAERVRAGRWGLFVLRAVKPGPPAGATTPESPS